MTRSFAEHSTTIASHQRHWTMQNAHWHWPTAILAPTNHCSSLIYPVLKSTFQLEFESGLLQQSRTTSQKPEANSTSDIFNTSSYLLANICFHRDHKIRFPFNCFTQYRQIIPGNDFQPHTSPHYSIWSTQITLNSFKYIISVRNFYLITKE